MVSLYLNIFTEIVNLGKSDRRKHIDEDTSDESSSIKACIICGQYGHRCGDGGVKGCSVAVLVYSLCICNPLVTVFFP